MLFVTWKPASAYHRLFALLLLLLGQSRDVSNISQVESTDSTTQGSHGLPSSETPRSARIPGHVRLQRAAKSSCLAPPQPANGEWKLSQDFCEEDNFYCKVPEGTELGLGYRLIYTCSSAYRVNGDNIVYCGLNQNWSTIPNCVEIRCPALNSVTKIAYCTYSRERVSCDFPMLPGTKAEVSCRPGYKEERTFLMPRRNMVDCNQNGEWDPHPLTCIPVCGQAVTRQKPLIIGGTIAPIGEFPWHVSLYVENSNNKTIKDYICGATLIKTNFLLTAAHCVYEEIRSRTIDPRKLFVITGNIFRDYDFPMHDMEITRKGRVKDVYVHYTYVGLKGNYGSDIALLELEEPFAFSQILLPACLENNDNAAPFLEPGSYGKIAGFGRTETHESSGILQTLTVPYISYFECKTSKYAVKNDVFITQDKFCAGYTNGSAVCEGDSGSGLVFKKNDQWYVMGIASVGLGVDLDNGERKCERFSYTLYTRVSVYTDWILEIVTDTEQRRSRPRGTQNSQSSQGMFSAPPSVIRVVASSTGKQSSSCLIPPLPANGKWEPDSSFCVDDSDCKILQGVKLKVGSWLGYKCDAGYTASENTKVSCQRGGTWSALPDCLGTQVLEVKCSALNSPLTMANCTTESGEWMSCDFAAAPGARGRISCRSGYKRDMSSVVETVVCNSNGKWEPNLGPCMPVCGKEIDRQMLFLKNGNPVLPGKFPWHASLYEQRTSTQGIKKQLICGATLIRANILLTAASCVYDEFTKSTVDRRNLFVIMGNIDRDYDSSLHDSHFVKKNLVKNVYRNCQYSGSSGNYASDIALLELQESFQFSEILLPVCLDVAGKNGMQVLQVGTSELERMAGFGRMAEGTASDVLVTVKLPYGTYDHCKQSEGAGQNEAFIKEGKFCPGFTYESSFCDDDRGGGLAYKKDEVWYIWGIASLSLGSGKKQSQKTCDSYSHAAYTEVSDYISWILKTMFEIEKQRHQQSC